MVRVVVEVVLAAAALVAGATSSALHSGLCNAPKSTTRCAMAYFSALPSAGHRLCVS